jgi:hypothetical protein
MQKSEQDIARENTAEFWNAHDEEFHNAQQKIDSGIDSYDLGFYSRSQEKGRQAQQEYQTLRMLSSNRADSSESEHERELIQLIVGIANHGRIAAGELMDASALSRRENPPTGRIQEHENNIDANMNQQSQMVNELISRLE